MTCCAHAAPVVRIAVRPARPEHAPAVAEALRHAAKGDSCCTFEVDPDTREFVLSGAGELNLEVVLKEAARIAGVGVTSSAPSVSYREGAGCEGPVVMTKSVNKLNRVCAGCVHVCVARMYARMNMGERAHSRFFLIDAHVLCVRRQLDF